jgi:hypothetical protein
MFCHIHRDQVPQMAPVQRAPVQISPAIKQLVIEQMTPLELSEILVAKLRL